VAEASPLGRKPLHRTGRTYRGRSKGNRYAAAAPGSPARPCSRTVSRSTDRAPSRGLCPEVVKPTCSKRMHRPERGVHLQSLSLGRSCGDSRCGGAASAPVGRQRPEDRAFPERDQKPALSDTGLAFFLGITICACMSLCHGRANEDRCVHMKLGAHFVRWTRLLFRRFHVRRCVRVSTSPGTDAWFSSPAEFRA
jgi:hypothetical protein